MDANAVRKYQSLIAHNPTRPHMNYLRKPPHNPPQDKNETKGKKREKTTAHKLSFYFPRRPTGRVYQSHVNTASILGSTGSEPQRTLLYLIGTSEIFSNRVSTLPYIRVEGEGGGVTAPCHSSALPTRARRTPCTRLTRT